MRMLTQESVEFKKCLTDKGLVYKYYQEVAWHIHDTLQKDNPIHLPRLEEDLDKIMEIMTECGNDHTKTKYKALRAVLRSDH